MDDLPELPFEKILGYLSLRDRIRSKAVSRRWYAVISSFKVDSLSYSERHSRSEEAKNFICAPGFRAFFSKANRKTMLSNLKKLRLSYFSDDVEDGTSPLAQAINSFKQLEELDIIRFNFKGSTYDSSYYCDLRRKLKLSLPLLRSIHLDELFNIGKLTLDAPKLKKVQVYRWDSSYRLDLVHGESVEWLMTDNMLEATVTVKQMKNLKYLYTIGKWIDFAGVSDLKQLKEMHLETLSPVYDLPDEFFKRKQHPDGLKIFFFGLCLDDPEETQILDGDEAFVYLAENESRMADQVLLYRPVRYSAIERVAPESQARLLKRFVDLGTIQADQPIQDVQRFLDFLKSFANIVRLWFRVPQPQELFNRLPGHCDVRSLTMCAVPDFEFLFKLKNLSVLRVNDSISQKLIRKVLEEFEYLSRFEFKHGHSHVKIEIELKHRDQKLFEVQIRYGEIWRYSSVNTVIQLINEDC